MTPPNSVERTARQRISRLLARSVIGTCIIGLIAMWIYAFGFASKESVNKINDEARGIYRYIDKSDQILYIGKGLIKQRASDAERANWGIDKIEYSVIEDENKALEWESYYIDLYVTTNGLRPPFNRIKGHSIKE